MRSIQPRVSEFRDSYSSNTIIVISVLTSITFSMLKTAARHIFSVLELCGIRRCILEYIIVHNIHPVH